MNARGVVYEALRPLLTLTLVTGLAAVPAVAQHEREHEHEQAGEEHSALVTAQYLSDLETLESKFLDLAEAMSVEQYLWRPMDGVRSVSEVFMLIVAENYIVPSYWDAVPPEGMTIEPSMFRSLSQVTDKEQVQGKLRESFAYYREIIGGLTAEKLHETIQMFGRERTVNEALFAISSDMHEHLGQAIAYARTNHVVPPWTARATANQ